MPLKVKGPICSMPTLWATKAKPHSPAVMSKRVSEVIYPLPFLSSLAIFNLPASSTTCKGVVVV